MKLAARVRLERVTAREPLFFGREARFAPRLHAAIERAGVPEAERAQGCGGEGGDLAELADSDDANGGIGESLVDAQFELAARQMYSAWQMAGVECVFLPYVEDDQVVLPLPCSYN